MREEPPDLSGKWTSEDGEYAHFAADGKVKLEAGGVFIEGTWTWLDPARLRIDPQGGAAPRTYAVTATSKALVLQEDSGSTKTYTRISKVLRSELLKLRTKAEKAFNDNRYDDALTAHRRTLILADGESGMEATAAEIRGIMEEVQEAKTRSEAAAKEFREFKKRVEAAAASPRELYDEGKKIQWKYKGAEHVPWWKDLADILIRLDAEDRSRKP